MLPILPLVLLAVALLACLGYQHARNDVYRVLAASLAAACCLWGFAIAHWSVHLVCLLLLLLPFNRLSFDGAEFD